MIQLVTALVSGTRGDEDPNVAVHEDEPARSGVVQIPVPISFTVS